MCIHLSVGERGGNASDWYVCVFFFGNGVERRFCFSSLWSRLFYLFFLKTGLLFMQCVDSPSHMTATVQPGIVSILLLKQVPQVKNTSSTFAN